MYPWYIVLTSLLADKSVKREVIFLWYLKNKIISPPCNSLEATLFIMPDERKRKVRVVGSESSRDLDVAEQPRMLERPLLISSPLISPLCMRLLFVKRRGGEWKMKVQRLTTSQKLSLLVGLCQFLVGASQRASPLKKQLGELVSIQRKTALDTAGLRIC